MKKKKLVLENVQRYVSKAQVCEILGISLSSVNRYIDSGKIPVVRLGGRVLIPAEALTLEALSASNVESI